MIDKKINKTSDKLGKAIAGETEKIVKDNTICKDCKKKK